MSATSTRRTAALIATGDELVLGSSLDTNSSAIASRLLDIGFFTRRLSVLGDDEESLVELLGDLCRRHTTVIITGGLGPTLDDVTRHAVARAAGVELVLNEEALRELRDWFERHGRPFARANERQALFPEGAEVLENPVGTAPGFCTTIGKALVFALPGPPHEMSVMLEGEVVPRLSRLAGGGEAFDRRSFHLFGLSEGVFADQCGSWMARDANPLIGVTAKSGILSVSLRAHGVDAEAARALADVCGGEMRERFSSWIFSETQPDLAFVVGHELIGRGIRTATAESCTGGLVAQKLTRVPGISAVFQAGFVTYANRAKSEMLGVDPVSIETHGAVSAQVAAEMARGAAARAAARVAVSVTGVAGPDGGTAEKPVGLVWFGVFRDGDLVAEERRFTVRGRDQIRELAANTALDLLRRNLPRP